MKAKIPASKAMRLRLRLVVNKEIVLGPGKAELLALIEETGSISEAARRMKMSYMRAWSLIQTMNRCLDNRVIETVRGGLERGGARLTPSGKRLLELFQTLETECLTATELTRQEIAALLK